MAITVLPLIRGAWPLKQSPGLRENAVVLVDQQFLGGAVTSFITKLFESMWQRGRVVACPKDRQKSDDRY